MWLAGRVPFVDEKLCVLYADAVWLSYVKLS